MDRAGMTAWSWIISLISLLSGAALAVGFLTPLAGIVAGLGAVSLAFSWVPTPALNLFDTTLATVFVVIVAAAVAFLGPGAFSVDARLFGRREIVIPHSARSSRH